MSYQGGDKAFLGREFLTWLWYKVETKGGSFMHGKGEIGVALDDFMAFMSDEEDSQEASIRKGRPSRTAEAYTSVVSGKKMSRARIHFAQRNRAWTATIKGDSLALASVKLPEIETEEGDDPITARLESLEGAFEVFGYLYRLFLDDRLDDGWEETAREIVGWAHKQLAKSKAGCEEPASA